MANDDEAILSRSDQLSNSLSYAIENAICRWIQHNDEHIEMLPEGILDVVISDTLVKMGIVIHVDKFGNNGLWIFLNTIASTLRQFDNNCPECGGYTDEGN